MTTACKCKNISRTHPPPHGSEGHHLNANILRTQTYRPRTGGQPRKRKIFTQQPTEMRENLHNGNAAQ